LGRSIETLSSSCSPKSHKWRSEALAPPRGEYGCLLAVGLALACTGASSLKWYENLGAAR